MTCIGLKLYKHNDRINFSYRNNLQINLYTYSYEGCK